MNNQDPSVQSPQDANTQKHINFLETAESETVGSQSFNEDEQSSTKQQWKEMREERLNNDQDPSLQSPQDANTQKHINFLEDGQSETTTGQSADEEEQSPAKQQWKEMREERMNNDKDAS